jgi:hypothetical protein
VSVQQPVLTGALIVMVCVSLRTAVPAGELDSAALPVVTDNLQVFAWGSGPCEWGEPSEPGQLVRVADGVDAGDPAVLDGDTDRSVDLTADVDPGRG